MPNPALPVLDAWLLDTAAAFPNDIAEKFGKTYCLGNVLASKIGLTTMGGLQAMSTHGVPQQPVLLTSWKEIATYLGKGVRTVQRWEQQFGLPVRRPNEKIKGIVHATTNELDSWLASQWSQRPREFFTPHNGEFVTAVRLSIRQSAELRSANRILLEDVRHTVASMFEECQSLARSMTGPPPPAR